MKGDSMNSQLVLVEGIPGVGKTTMAKKIKEYLDKQNVQSKLYLEGDFNHPADYECVAYFDKEQYDHLIKKFKIEEERIKDFIDIKDTDYFINYGMIRKNKIYNDNKPFLKALMSNDVYSLPIQKFIQVTKDKWKRFVKTSENESCVYILECCFMQNPLTTMLAYHNQSEYLINEHIKNLSRIVKPLNPIMIFLEPKNIKENFDFIKQNRSKEWYNFVEDYVTNQAYGKENSLKEYDGLITFYEHLQKLALECFALLDMVKIKKENSKINWDKNERGIYSFIDQYI